MSAIQNIRNTSPARSPSDLDGLRVLIVEDSWHLSTGLRRLLEERGATVDGPVATTADAMRLVSESTPDVALVDINLRDGELSYELIDWLQDRGIRIVVLTGYSDISLPGGKVAVILQKPARDEVLIASLREPEQGEGNQAG
jgi:ActR/RegA family two-component response regulator